MDSADGVARFWVGEHVGVVERCLVDLHRRGLLERRTIAGTDFFSLRQNAQPVAEERPGARDGYLSALTTLIRTIENLRPETRERSARVADTAAAIAEAMAVPVPRIQLLKRAAALHALGRLFGSPANGSGETNDASAFMATEKILAPINSLHDVREIILRAGDWCEANPNLLGISHAMIPLESRILAVSEEFVCGITSSGDVRSALERIRTRYDQQNDSAVIETLLRLVEEGALR